MTTRSSVLVKFIETVPDFCVQFEATFLGEKSDFRKAKRAITSTRIIHGIIGLTFSSVIFYLYVPCLFQFQGTSLCQSPSDRNQAWFAFLGVLLGYLVSFYQDTLMISLLHIIENIFLEVSFFIMHQNRNK